MFFNSIDFAIFLPTIFIIYWLVGKKNVRKQNLLIVLASYLFYGWWDWRFLSLIIFSTLVDYSVGLLLEKKEDSKQRKWLLAASIITNIGFLGFFKYYNFFLTNFLAAFSLFGIELSPGSLNIVLPVGISFYTFQTMSYTIDVYKKKLNATEDFIQFSAYVSFFPQLVAGPIERATNLLPQFKKQRSFVYKDAVDGMRQILWGLFKKIVIADNAAVFANQIFANSSEYSGGILLIGALFFTFQIYCDFSGYSDIAIGVARLFGFNLMQNFAFPYFSRDIAEFWRRWHISLSTWFRDYVYIPLGGSRGSNTMRIRNVFIIFIVSGFWHGANWTFIIWGALNAVYFLPLLLSEKNRINTNNVAQNKWFPSFKELTQIVITFSLTVLAWIFFRAESVTHAVEYSSAMIFGLFKFESYQMLYNYISTDVGFRLPAIIVVFMIVEWFGREGQYGIHKIDRFLNKPLRWMTYLIITMSIYFLGYYSDSIEFIYFQF
jgi:D-alanyl-lipoteichoic acid acyltransferase DltB (MBOAT superfamily)